jgi:hypothetical protein
MNIILRAGVVCPEVRRDAVSDLVNRLNALFYQGKFLLDMEDGTIYFLLSTPIDINSITPDSCIELLTILTDYSIDIVNDALHAIILTTVSHISASDAISMCYAVQGDSNITMPIPEKLLNVSSIMLN